MSVSEWLKFLIIFKALHYNASSASFCSIGWVKTRMGGDKAPLSPDQTVSNMVKILVEDSRDLNGKFLNHDGKELPW